MRRIVHAFFGCVVLSLLLCGISADLCAKVKLPKKIRKKFSEDMYIIRSGSGETPENAAESARFEIVKYFESKISGETFIHEWAKSKKTKGK